MKAMVYRSYGAPDVLHCEDVEMPAVADDEVLVRVRAAAVNPMDYHLMAGTLVLRPLTGLHAPKLTRPGTDVAGAVEAVGRNVTRFQVGDEVFGAARGTFAEYASAKEKRLAQKPAGISFEQAAAVPVAGLTALQGLRDKARLHAGQNVLINGAAGGVGTFAVQIAKSLGALVTGVCSTKNVDLVRSIGADDVIDYTKEDFTASARRYDVIFDCVGNRPLSACRRVMHPKATFVAVGVKAGGPWMGPLPSLLNVIVSSWFVSQKAIFFIAAITAKDLAILMELIEAHQVTPVIGGRYPLSEAAEAVRYVKSRHARGKVVITVE